MLELIILRHAKAERRPGVGDKDRALDKTGQEEAAAIGAWLRAENIRPALALVSDSRRTRETLESVLSQNVAPPGAIRLLYELYDAPEERMFDLLQSIDKGPSPVLLIGHNPGLARLANDLCADGEARALSTLRSGLPTGALALIAFRIDDWRRLTWRSGFLARFATPDSVRARRKKR